MAEYIDRKTLKMGIEDRQGWQDQKTACRFKEGYDCGLEAAIEDIEKAPAADVAPVVHGLWIKDKSGVVYCSECGEEHEWLDFRATYCDACGAKMDGRESHE